MESTDKIFIDSESFGIVDKNPIQPIGTIGMDNEDDLEILKFVVEYLQMLGKKMDQEYAQNATTPEEYREQTKVINLLETRQGKEYLIISALLGMIAKTPNYAKIIAPFMSDDALFVELLNSIDIMADTQTGMLKIEMSDAAMLKRESGLII
jgi:hypothetical protein